MTKEFSWLDDNDAVIRSYGDLAVYQNERGDIVIRQQDSMGNDDAVVIVAAVHAKLFLKMFREAAKP